MRQLSLCVLPIVLFLACGADSKSHLNELNLMRYSIPVSIMAPDSAKVSTAEVSGVMRDVTIISEEDNYAVQIFSGRAFTNDLARLKADQLELVRENPYFERIVFEEPSGFIFENRIDSTANFGFRYILYRGDNEIIFQNGMGRIFNEEEARGMYEAVQQ